MRHPPAGRRLLLAGLVPLALSWLAQIAAADTRSGPSLLDGVGLHGPMTWGRTDPQREHYAWPVYSGQQYEVPTALLAKVKAAGFDFIRLTVDPGPFLAATDARRQQLDRRLLETVAAIRKAGLDLIVDFHPIHMMTDYGPERIEANADGLFDAYVAMLRHAARLLARQSAHVAIEVMNEPQLGYHFFQQPRLQDMEEAMFQAVRAEAPDTTIIVSGGRGGSLEGLLELDPGPFDRNVRYSFHYYIPYLFTMQGIKNSSPNARIWAYAAGLPYPAKPEDLAKYRSLIQTRIAGSNRPPQEQAAIIADGQQQIQAYFHGKGTRAAIAADFDKVARWADAHGIPRDRILLGEFGATQTIPGHTAAYANDRARWLTDVREEAEWHGFHWSMWSLNGVSNSLGMTLVSPADPDAIDPKTAAALGKARHLHGPAPDVTPIPSSVAHPEKRL